MQGSWFGQGRRALEVKVCFSCVWVRVWVQVRLGHEVEERLREKFMRCW